MGFVSSKLAEPPHARRRGTRREGGWDAPLTRPNSTKPPAATMREFSPWLVGLWSNESGFASPPTDMTARESPALACTQEQRVSEVRKSERGARREEGGGRTQTMFISGVMMAETAVQPDGSPRKSGSARSKHDEGKREGGSARSAKGGGASCGPTRTRHLSALARRRKGQEDSLARRSSSVSKYARFKLASQSLRLKAALAARREWTVSPANFATVEPAREGRAGQRALAHGKRARERAGTHHHGRRRRRRRTSSCRRSRRRARGRSRGRPPWLHGGKSARAPARVSSCPCWRGPRARRQPARRSPASRIGRANVDLGRSEKGASCSLSLQPCISLTAHASLQVRATWSARSDPGQTGACSRRQRGEASDGPAEARASSCCPTVGESGGERGRGDAPVIGTFLRVLVLHGLGEGLAHGGRGARGGATTRRVVGAKGRAGRGDGRWCCRASWVRVAGWRESTGEASLAVVRERGSAR